MSDTTARLKLRLSGARELQSVVRTMKSLAASSIGQYQTAVRALSDYSRAADLGLGACLRERSLVSPAAAERSVDAGRAVVVVFGSDQGLVGQFNDLVADFAVKSLQGVHGEPHVWAVGERVHVRLKDRGLAPAGVYGVPSSVAGITSLVDQILSQALGSDAAAHLGALSVFYNRSSSGARFAPVREVLLPLNDIWRRAHAAVGWPTKTRPELMGGSTVVLRALLQEYLFVSLFRASAESLASENASRLAAMERAEKNIKDSLERLEGAFHRVRQASIDEELFDVVAGFEASSIPVG